MQSRKQKQAWIENWTIWALSGITGMLQHILDQAAYHRLLAHSQLGALIAEMKVVIFDIKEEQAGRKAKRK